MHEIKCPHCGKTFTVEEGDYQLIVSQIKNDEFVRFKELENEIDFLIFEINNHLKELTNERRCKNESNQW